MSGEVHQGEPKFGPKSLANKLKVWRVVNFNLECRNYLENMKTILINYRELYVQNPMISLRIHYLTCVNRITIVTINVAYKKK